MFLYHWGPVLDAQQESAKEFRQHSSHLSRPEEALTIVVSFKFQEVVSFCTLPPSLSPFFLKARFSQITISQTVLYSDNRSIREKRVVSDYGWLIVAPKDLSSARPQNL